MMPHGPFFTHQETRVIQGNIRNPRLTESTIDASTDPFLLLLAVGTVPTALTVYVSSSPQRETFPFFFYFFFLFCWYSTACVLFPGGFFLLPAYFIAWLLGLRAPTEFWLDNRAMEENQAKTNWYGTRAIRSIVPSSEVQSMHPWLEKLAMVCYRKEKNDAKFRRRCLARNHAIIFLGFLFLTYSPHHFSRYGRQLLQSLPS